MHDLAMCGGQNACSVSFYNLAVHKIADLVNGSTIDDLMIRKDPASLKKASISSKRLFIQTR